ncbi:uncharacterized protein LTR77_009423 [Saxophila tyrrhenica]|uniref:Amino acid transporter transmembrane domain-containing protein n=1 Tax=Saxophila tyrrhenica TaxID=1690608 RepID=A0AAV9P1F9_9PEZI|nr:hypothetical protein LTR77_009423 [Saxophila tyrrhenica]
MSAVVPIGIPHPSTVEVSNDDPVLRANSIIEEKHPGLIERHPEIRERTWGLAARTDPTVSIFEYFYWAKVEREIEQNENRKYIESRGKMTNPTRLITDRFSKGTHHEANSEAKAPTAEITSKSSKEDVMAVTDAEWRTAARALRTAGWGTIFYLVTTDILGWSSSPAVFAAVGFGPGVALFVIFGAAAGFSGWSLWKVYIGLDSARFPMISFGDPYLRLFGPRWRHCINFAQALQQFLSVCVVILGNATVLDQMAKQKICFAVVIVIITVVGIISGFVRTLQRLGWMCNLSVWLNVANFIIIMYAAGNNAIDYAAVLASTIITKVRPIRTFASQPPDMYQQATPGFASQFGAVGTMVYAYAGALLFVAFMAEMRHPMDFWKGMLCAQVFICFTYILFGAYVYSEWGQYAIFNINTVVQPRALQTAGNALTLITGWFAVFLYANVGLKTVYQEVFMEIFKFPPVGTKKGGWCWYIISPIYWSLAFVVATGVPNIQGLVSFIGGLFALNFTYTFPVLLFLAYSIQRGAVQDGEGFDPYTGVTTQHDFGMKRLSRGFMKKWYINVPVTLFILGALACSGMSTWAAIESLISIFGPNGTNATHFGCGSPTG